MLQLAFVVSIGLTLGSSGFAAPYPIDGKVVEWVQPDGSRLTLRVFGDEFYARSATADGYTVLLGTDNAYYYARLAEDGENLVTSGVKAHLPPPRDVARHLQEAPRVIAAKRKQNVDALAPRRAADWAARKKAVQEKRARDAQQASH